MIDVRGLSARLGEFELRDVTFDVPAGSYGVVIGPAGSGKTTLLEAIAGVVRVTSGSVTLNGRSVATVPPDQRGVGLVYQHAYLFPHLSVLDNVALAPMRAQGTPRAEAEQRARELLARFGLEGREDQPPDRLSGGQQQRVAIARALAIDPRALLLDEVTSALDPELVGEVLDAIRELKEGGMTMIIATHEMGFARDVADEVCFLHEGRIVERGAPERIFSAPEQPETQRFLRRLLEAR